MTLQEELEKTLSKYGFNKNESIAIVKRVMEISEEGDSEIKGQWHKEFRDLIPPGRDKSDYTPEELEKLQDAVFCGIWIITKHEVRKYLYVRMEDLAELIVKFK